MGSPTLPPARLSDAELTRAVKQGFQVEPQSDDSPVAKQRNLERANDELGHISALSGNPSFNWFFENCIEAQFRDIRASLELSDVKPEDLPRLHAKFTALRKIVRWLDEREIEHRKLEDPGDPKINILRARLALH